MKHKKGVIGIYWVVTAAIALVILLFMVYFVRAGIGGGVSDMFRAKDEFTNDIENERMVCESLCNQAISRAYQDPPVGHSQWRASGFCTRAANVDLNGDGTISAVDGETGLKCWERHVAFVHCDSRLNDGTPVNQCSCSTASACDLDSDCPVATPTCDLETCTCV